MTSIQGAVVLCMLFTRATVSSQDPPAFHQGPQYTFNCLETGELEVKGVSTVTSLTVGGTCNRVIAKNSHDSGKITIPKNCLVPADNFESERTVTLTINDSTFDGTQRTIITQTVSGLNGGQDKHQITVKCEPLRNKGMMAYVIHGVGLATPEAKIPTEVQKVEMRLKSEKYDSYEDVTQLPDVSTVYIGDKFYMYLVYLGTDPYSVIPIKCTAFKGSFASEPTSTPQQLDLYTNTNSCIPDNAKNYRVMHKFETLTSGTRIVRAEMFGFLFDKDAEITFVCSVNICRDGTTTCKLPTNCVDWNARKRRSAKHDKQYTITKRLRVQRKTSQNSAGFIKSSCFCIILLQLFLRMW